MNKRNSNEHNIWIILFNIILKRCRGFEEIIVKKVKAFHTLLRKCSTMVYINSFVLMENPTNEIMLNLISATVFQGWQNFSQW